MPEGDGMKSDKPKSKYMNYVPSGGGRPKLIINEEGKQMIEVLAGYLCTDEEIADTLQVSVDVLTNKNNRQTFAECKKRGVSKGKVSLRRMQFKLAEKNAGMAIFLGKQYLGQSDVVKDKQEYEDDGKLTINYDYGSEDDETD